MTLQTLNTLPFAIFYSNIKHVMQLIKTMLVKFQLLFVLDLNPMLNLCMTQRPSKVLIHYRDKLNALLKELKNITLSNK